MSIKCPVCKESELRRIMTEQGVIVDCCPACKGVWLDKGEILLFAKDSGLIKEEIEKGVQQGLPSGCTCPETNESMIKIPLLNNTLFADYCPTTQALWLGEDELKKLAHNAHKDLSITFDEKDLARLQSNKMQERRAEEGNRFHKTLGLLPLPNLALRSSTVLIGLYGLLVVALIMLVEFAGLSPHVAFIIGIAICTFQFLLGPFVMDLSLRWFYKMHWVSPADLPSHLRDFVQTTCEKHGMKFPRMGLIHDGSPNAFTYGHHPNNARIVVTQGILDLLNEQEAESVVAHEIGHAKHWDMLIMTVAQVVPLILYYIYRTVISIKTDGDDDTGGYRLAIAIGAFVLYIISEYVVLWLSRTREYYADRFAGETMGDPNFLASALVKIGYGLAGQQPEKDTEKGKEKAKKGNAPLEAVGALGIFDIHTARSLAVTGYNKSGSMGGEVDKGNLKGAMRWDLWNPWAKYHEIHSTHPLIANRLRYLSNQAASSGLTPYIVFDEVKTESYWDEFLVDIGVRFSPLLAVLVFGGLYLWNPSGPFLGLGIAALGISLLFKTLFSYKHGHFPEMTIANLLKEVKVSSVRPVPCTLKGMVIGRGVPGLIWSEDFVLQDDTGIIFLDYKQPFRIWEFLFAIFRRESLQNQEVTITGWYRRAPIPYVELKTLNSSLKQRTCYVYHFKLASAIIVTAIGLFVILAV